MTVYLMVIGNLDADPGAVHYSVANTCDIFIHLSVCWLPHSCGSSWPSFCLEAMAIQRHWSHIFGEVGEPTIWVRSLKLVPDYDLLPLAKGIVS